LKEGATAVDTVEIPADDPMFDQPIELYVAISKGGQHSGVEECYMRYAAAEAYVHRRHADWRVLLSDPEIKGRTLCDSKTGTGVNLATRKPWPRYGDAGMGKCVEQVNCVDGSVP
jgi:hypothetical protein